MYSEIIINKTEGEKIRSVDITKYLGGLLAVNSSVLCDDNGDILSSRQGEKYDAVFEHSYNMDGVNKSAEDSWKI